MIHGEIWLIDFGVPVGSLPAKIRPAVVMQNDLLGIKNLNTVCVIPLTSNLVLSEYEPNVFFKKEETNLSKDSVAVILKLVIFTSIVIKSVTYIYIISYKNIYLKPFFI